jgi:molecular chaperone GrpE (heat shock protein)
LCTEESDLEDLLYLLLFTHPNFILEFPLAPRLKNQDVMSLLRTCTSLCFLFSVLSSVGTSWAFTFSSKGCGTNNVVSARFTTSRFVTSPFSLPTFCGKIGSTATVLRLANEDKEEWDSMGDDNKVDEVDSEKEQGPHATNSSSTEEDHTTSSSDEGTIPEEESLVLSAHQEDEEEDEEVMALKKEIAALEGTLHTKRVECSRLEDMVEDFSEAGYLRKCADMENIRKRSVSSHQTSKYISRASVLQKHFVPILEEMSTLQQKYANTPNGKSYDTLRSDMMLALQKKIDVSTFDSIVGKEVNKQRDDIVGYEASDTIPKGMVVRSVKSGLEVHGNIVCPAQCIVSQGPTAEVKQEESTESHVDEGMDTMGTNEDVEGAEILS